MKKAPPTETTVNGTKYMLKQCEVVRYEDEFGHSYAVDGEAVAGVTTLLSMGTPVESSLLEYFKRTDKETQEQILEDAMERGSNVHHAIEALLFGKTVESAALSRRREQAGVAAFVDFFETVKPQDVVSEQVVAYKKADILFAGTLDFICTVNGKRLLIDFKTGTAASRKHELQVEAYKAAVEQSSDERIDACYVLHVGTNHKGARPKLDGLGLPNCGAGWMLVPSTATFQDFGLAYRMALFMNHGKYPTPPKIAKYPDSWQLLEVQRKVTNEEL